MPHGRPWLLEADADAVAALFVAVTAENALFLMKKIYGGPDATPQGGFVHGFQCSNLRNC